MKREDRHPVIRVKNLARAFGNKVVHRDISFELHHGEILTIMGSSGSGKTLLIKSLIGLARPDAGQIEFEGLDLCTLDQDYFRKVRLRIGFVFQEGALFNSLTVEENLSYPLERRSSLSPAEIHEIVNSRLEMIDLQGTNNLYPAELSGGMERRVGLLRATMLEPPVVLFDEPTAGLDPMLVASFARKLRDIKQRTGFSGIFITHDVPCALAISDRIAILDKGTIRAIGTTEEIKNSSDPWVHSFLFPDFGGPVYGVRTS